MMHVFCKGYCAVYIASGRLVPEMTEGCVSFFLSSLAMSLVPRLAYSTLPRPTLTSQAIINPSFPLTPKTLRRIQDALSEAASEWSAPRDVKRTKAAVLCPLINVPVDGVDGRRTTKPGILFQIRANLRTHAGEVRYAYFRRHED